MEFLISLNLAKVGFVVPTLGQRVDFLLECISSIKSAGVPKQYILWVQKNKIEHISNIHEMCSEILDDPGEGLPAAINFGISKMPDYVTYVAWLGDDDLLTEDSLLNSIKVLENDSNVVATYGACAYIDENSELIFVNKSGRWASVFMNFLPNLIPQPGSIFRRSAFEIVEGAGGRYPLSFDFELFFKLKQIGKLKYIPKVQSKFRWHKNSLSVNQRRIAVRQTSQIRKQNLPQWVKPFSIFWEPIIMIATVVIGIFLDKRTTLGAK